MSRPGTWTTLALLALGFFSRNAAQAASLQQLNVTLANNPTNVGFYVYVPDALATKPPILVNPHWCHGDALSAYAGSTFAPTLAEEYGFIVIYPDSPNTVDKCWDVSSPQTLTHGGAGDSQGIVSMVEWTLERYNGDKGRVFVTGVSSGAMMTNVLVGVYPDVFAGGSAFAGVADGCFGYGRNKTSAMEDVDYWNSDCAEGTVKLTPAEWTGIVEKQYPGYRGWRPKMQVFHGTADEVLNFTNLGEEIKQWTGVFGLLTEKEQEELSVPEPTRTMVDIPLAYWTKMIYGTEDEDERSWFEAYSAWNVTHNIPVQEDVVVDFFDLACTGTDCFRWGGGRRSM